MNGSIEYENQYQKKIDGLLMSNKKLCGFYSFIGDKSISTIYNYLLHINSFLSYIESKPLHTLNVDDFAGYMMKIQRNKNGERSTSSYRIAAYSALKKYGNYLVASGVISNNPMNFIDRPKAVDSQHTIEKREHGYLEKKEISKYIKAVETGVGTSRSKNRQKNWVERDLAITTLFLVTGIRCSALYKIDVSDIDFEHNTLVVTDKESKVNVYDLTDETMGILANWMDKRHVLLNGKRENALFISNQRKRMNQHSVYDVVNKYAQGINGKHITPHKLRATYGTQLYNATGDIYFVQKCMNHNSPKTTETYIRGVKNTSKKASDIMGGLIHK